MMVELDETAPTPVVIYLGVFPATVFFIAAVAAAAATGAKLINLDFLFANLRLGRCPTIHNNNKKKMEKS